MLNKIFSLLCVFLAGVLVLPISAQPVEDEAQVQEEQAIAPLSDGLKQEVSLNTKLSLSPEEAPAAQEPVVPAENKIVKVIEIKGNKTISLSIILSKVKTRVGQEYLQNVVSDDLKRLYNSGYFSDVSVDHQDYEDGFRVVFYVTEKPIIEKITFSKTRQFNSKAFLPKIKTKEGKFLDNKILKDDIDTIKDLYIKKGLTNVSVEAETSVDETTHKAKLHFIIQEGDRVKIAKINVIGNSAFTSKRIIKLIKTRSAWLFNSGYLKDEILDEDMDRIKSFYEREGFIDIKADYALDYQEKGRLIVNINVEEGNRYYTGKILVKGATILSQEEILAKMKEIKVGHIFSREKLDLDVDEIRSAYFDKGYIFANIEKTTSLNPETGKVEIALDVHEGELAYVNRVKVQGNTRTRDIVVRRELRMNPGDRFDGEKLRRSKERLRNLGYFEDINYDIEDTDVANKKDLVVQVQEAKTGNLSFGGGYSTIDQLVGFVEIEQKNFDFTNWPTFTGGGQNLVIHAETGSVRNNQRLSFTEPWLFDYPISGGFDLYRMQHSRERDVGYAYDERTVGGDIRFGKQLSEYLSASTSYKLENIKISNLEEGVSSELAREVGENTISTMSFGLAHDGRDNVFNPSKGLYTSGTVDVAGGLFAGDKDFVRFQTKTSYDIPMMYGSVLEFRLRTGFADAYGDSDFVPIYERFFAGGAYSIRGYNERKVGPLDSATNDPIGGESMFIGNIEYTIPLVDFIRVAGFFDTGNVWSKIDDFASGDLKSGAGLGLRVKTPIGPINLDYGYPLSDEPGEESRSGKFYFSVSRGF
ncbi:MAG: outer membrane protein assembly factor BamA [Candidatus Omnitrophota bacterium]